MTPTRLTAWLAGLFGIISLSRLAWLFVITGLGLLLPTRDTGFVSRLSEAAPMVGLCLWFLSPYAILVAAARFGKFRTVTWGAPAVLVIVGFYDNLDYVDENFHLWAKSDAQVQSVYAIPFIPNVVAVGSMCVLFAIGYWLEKRKEKGADRSAPRSDG